MSVPSKVDYIRTFQPDDPALQTTYPLSEDQQYAALYSDRPGTHRPSHVSTDTYVSEHKSIEKPPLDHKYVQDYSNKAPGGDPPPVFAINKVEQPGFFSRHKLWILLIIWAGITAYYIAAMVKSPTRDPVVLSLLYAFITFKFLFEFVPISIVSRPIGAVWNIAIAHPVGMIPARIRNIIGIIIPLILLGLILALQPDSANGTRLQRLQSALGLFCFVALLYATSTNRGAIKWRIVIVGILLQFLLGLFILKTPVGLSIFNWLSGLAGSFLDYSKFGTKFVFGENIPFASFAVNALPAILFFASFIKILYYWGAMQWIVQKIAWLMVRLMDTSGSESVVAAASPFVGQGESSLLVKPFIEDMTVAEIHSIMTSGFATIAGSVLVAYISFGIDARSLITACVMSTPCSLAVSKLRYPETEQSLTKGDVHVPEEKDREANFLHAASNGADQGVHLALLITGNIMAIISLLYLVNGMLSYFGTFVGYPNVTLVLIARYLFVPLAWMVGVPTSEVLTVAGLMAEKMLVNEFVAYSDLSALAKAGHISNRAQFLTTFSLCGFANFASIGIQIGCIGAIAPGRKADLARLAMSAMICGTMCTFMTATIAGMLM